MSVKLKPKAFIKTYYNKTHRNVSFDEKNIFILRKPFLNLAF